MLLLLTLAQVRRTLGNLEVQRRHWGREQRSKEDTIFTSYLSLNREFAIPELLTFLSCSITDPNSCCKRSTLSNNQHATGFYSDILY